MKLRMFLPTVAVLFAALTLPTQTFAQSTNVKTPNKNQSAKFKSAIFKGSGNLIESNSIASFIGGGQSNKITLGVTNGVIGGGFANVVSNHFGTVSGGLANAAGGNHATVGGGHTNKANGSRATVAGGEFNAASGSGATVSGGLQNKASGFAAIVSGGFGNAASAERAASGGLPGGLNLLAGNLATVGGGFRNHASGLFSTVPGGANGIATNEGAFVWSGVDSVETVSTNPNSFTVRAPGGVRFITSTNTNNLAIGSGTNGVAVAPNGTAWVSLSDSNAKTAVRSVDPRQVLAKLDRLPVTEWEYKHDPHRRYFGPMAQDFHAAFGLGNDDKTINTLDADGVLFLSVKGLVEELKERDKAIEQLRTKNAEFEAKIGDLDQSISELRAIRAQMPNSPPSP